MLDSRRDYTGRVLGSWHLVRPLGKGGSGVVYEARHKVIPGRLAAVKLLHPHLAQDPESRRRFLNEATAVSRADHENIVQVFDGGFDDELCFLIMELLQGQSLSALLREVGPLAPPRAIGIALQVAGALAAAHRCGIVHRDLKPGNLIVVQRPHRADFVKVLDFGIAKLRQGESMASAIPLTKKGAVIGTPAYMSPEQAMGRNDLIDERSDIYSAAVLLHELLSLRHYLKEVTSLNGVLMAIATEPFSYWQLIFVRHPSHPVPRSELLHFVAKGLHKDPNQRFQSVIEMIGELQRLIDGRCAVLCPATLAKRMTREVTGFIERFPKLSPFVFYPALLFLFYSVAFTIYRTVL